MKSLIIKTIGGIFLLLVALICGATDATDIPQECQRRAVYYINGILTYEQDAFFSLNKLDNAYRIKHPMDKNPPHFKLAYNPTGKYLGGVGGGLDFIESFSQQLGLGVSRVWRMIAGSESITEPQANSMIQYINQGIIAVSNPDYLTLDKIYRDLERDILNKYTIVIVSHSQGNLWSNSIMVLLDPVWLASVSQVGVAVPDSRLERSLVPHVTLREDLIIRGIPYSMHWTDENGYGPLEIYRRIFGHSFDDAYMESGKPSRESILSDIDQSFRSLQSMVQLESCLLKTILHVDNTQVGWYGLPATIELSGFTSTTPDRFQIRGSNSVCVIGGGERGSPLFSYQVDADSNFLAAINTRGVPYGNFFTNGRPCSSFVAFNTVLDPATDEVKIGKIWINGAQRAFGSSGGFPYDWEYQVRFYSGDPENGYAGKKCQVGVVPNSGYWSSNLDAANCSYELIFSQ